MSDPLSEILDSDSSSCLSTPTRSLLLRMYELSAPEVFLQEIEKLLERVVLLEMFLEEERKITVSAEELKDFHARRLPEIRKEVGRLASIIYGAITRREGG